MLAATLFYALSWLCNANSRTELGMGLRALKSMLTHRPGVWTEVDTQGTRLVNASTCTLRYQPSNAPVVLEISANEPLPRDQALVDLVRERLSEPSLRVDLDDL